MSRRTEPVAMARTPRLGVRHGFTLLELLVVLLLLAITTAAAVPAFLGDRLASPEQRAATSVANVLTGARDKARESGSPVTATFAPVDRRFWITTRNSVDGGVLWTSPAVRIVHPVSDRLTCRFEATGTATPCEITVRGARDLVVRVNEWSGDVRIAGTGA